MKIEIVKYKCDCCGKEVKKENIFIGINYPLIFTTNQTDGVACKPYIQNKNVDLCDDCANKVLKLEASGAMGYDTLKIREEE